MANEAMKHNDCVNFCPIDVAKGICRKTNNMIFIDTPVCANFSEVSKCRNCSNYKEENKDNVGIGVCTGFKKEAWTFAELNAVTCESYKTSK